MLLLCKRIRERGIEAIVQFTCMVLPTYILILLHGWFANNFYITAVTVMPICVLHDCFFIIVLHVYIIILQFISEQQAIKLPNIMPQSVPSETPPLHHPTISTKHTSTSSHPHKVTTHPLAMATKPPYITSLPPILQFIN